MSRRGQAAIEFLLLFGFMLLVFTVAYLIIQERATNRNEQAGVRELASIAHAITQEVSLASRVHDGYNRTFDLPLFVTRGEYTITLAPASHPSEVTLNDSEAEFVVFLPVNLTTGSVLVPGTNFISRTAGNITTGEVSAPVCEDGDGDTYDGAGSAGVPTCAQPNTDCDDDDATIHPGAETSCEPIDRDCDGVSDDAAPACLICAPPQTNTVYFAGGTPADNEFASAGTVWDARTEGDPAGICCDSITQCAITDGIASACPSHGWVEDTTFNIPFGQQSDGTATNREWVCANMSYGGTTPTGAKLIRCTSDNDGKVLQNATHAYCCSRFTNSIQAQYYGTWGFNAGWTGNANKVDDITVAGSCSDGSDNDCDGKRDGYDDLCWNALLNSTCGGNSAYENLTAYPNSTMPAVTRFAYDWRVNGVSILVAQYLFDVPNSSGENTTRDYAQGMRNATTGANTDATTPRWDPTTGRGGSGAYYFQAGKYLNLTTVEPVGAYAIEAWIKSDDVSRNRSIIVRTDGSGPGSSWSQQLRFNGSASGAYVFEHYAWDQAASKGVVVRGTTSIVPNTWYHVVGTGAPNGKLRLFVNGVEEGTPAAITTPWMSGTTWLIGSNTGGGFQVFRGWIDEVRIYNRNLTPEQIRANYLSNGINRTVAAELAAGQSWSVVVYPNNGTHDGLDITSGAIAVTAGPDACTSCAGCMSDGTCYAVGAQIGSCQTCQSAGVIANLADGTACTSNGVFCDGVEQCQAGVCSSPGTPCGGEQPLCNEASDRCDQCIVNSDCTSQCWYTYFSGPIIGTHHLIQYGGVGICGADGTCGYGSQSVCYDRSANYTGAVSDWCHETGQVPTGCCGQLGFLCPS